MSRINYASLISDRPEFAHVWSRLGFWRSTHAKAKVIEPKAIARFLKDVTPESLLNALQFLADSNHIRRAYMLRAPNGQILKGIYDSPLDIPDEVAGTFEESVSAKDAQLIAVFVEDLDE